MRRIDRYWKRCAAGMMAALMLMTAGEGGFTSFAAQSLNSPSKIVISNTQKMCIRDRLYRDEESAGYSFLGS